MELRYIWSRLVPASKKQLNDRAKQLEKMLNKKTSSLESKITATSKDTRKYIQDKVSVKIDRMGKDLDTRLDRIEQILMSQLGGVTEKKRTPQIIVALTSYPKRIMYVEYVIERLLNQTLKPDRIVLYLAKDNFPNVERELPQRLLDMESRGLEIHWCDTDIKSYKKLVPALIEYPDDVIITVDDDLYYDLNIVERLYDSYKRYPNAVSALRVHKMNFDDSVLLPYAQWDMSTSEISNEPSMRLFATTGGGTLFPPHVLHKDAVNAQLFQKLCPNADDVWFKFMMILNQTPVVLAGRCVWLKYIEGTQEESLWATNKQENDMQIQNVLSYYQDYMIDGKSIEAYLSTSD